MRKRRRRETDLLGGDGDLVGLLVGLLADEPHHLLDLLGYIGVIHLGGRGSDGPSGCSACSGDRRAGVDGSAGAGTGKGGNRGSPRDREWSRWRSWGYSSRGSNVIGLAPVVAAACLYVLYH